MVYNYNSIYVLDRYFQDIRCNIEIFLKKVSVLNLLHTMQQQKREKERDRDRLRKFWSLGRHFKTTLMFTLLMVHIF